MARQLVCDRQGQADVILAVRVGPMWTDAVVIESEQRCVAARVRTSDDPTALVVPGESGRPAVWRRDGRCVDVLAELFELPAPGVGPVGLGGWGGPP
ncbi:MAG: hypothetical protein GEV09_01270 [Pseudonocardiaceae bacterium]|nr:hypothetical protein [Pseudonocardiaceae bacterium]